MSKNTNTNMRPDFTNFDYSNKYFRPDITLAPNDLQTKGRVECTHLQSCKYCQAELRSLIIEAYETKPSL